MKRLRHPVRAIREPFGTAGLVVACVALIAALGGTALAAAKLNSTQKKEVEKIAKKYAGAPGAPGAAGPTGPAGAAGKDGGAGEKGEKGATGEKGEKGATGEKGAKGNPGAGVETEAIAPGPTDTKCDEQGGTEFEVEGAGGNAEVICNGKEGSPWTLGGTLPSGAIETGSFAVNSSQADAIPVEVEEPEGSGIFVVVDHLVIAPITFSIPLSAGLGAEEVHFQGQPNFGDFDEGGTGTIGCKGTFQKPDLGENPPATSNPAGNLCLYKIPGQFENANIVGIYPLNTGAGGGEPGARRAGAVVVLSVPASGPSHAIGDFAVTAP